jgi:hypothetical protein
MDAAGIILIRCSHEQVGDTVIVHVIRGGYGNRKGTTRLGSWRGDATHRGSRKKVEPTGVENWPDGGLTWHSNREVR